MVRNTEERWSAALAWLKNTKVPNIDALRQYSATVVAIALFPEPATPRSHKTFCFVSDRIQSAISIRTSERVPSRHVLRANASMWEGLSCRSRSDRSWSTTKIVASAKTYIYNQLSQTYPRLSHASMLKSMHYATQCRSPVSS